MSEQFLVQCSAPTLAGLKTGNLFNCEYESKLQVIAELQDLNRRLSPSGIFIIPLRYSERRVLLYLFRPQWLDRDLQDSLASSILRKEGYPQGKWMVCVHELIRRLNSQPEFPHEIGLFLGYPPEDVSGFIENKGKDSKMTGCWKVYGDVEFARRKFSDFKQCTAEFTEKSRSGVKLEHLAAAHAYT